MKAVQIDRYSKEIRTVLREIPVPEIGPTEVLVEVRAAAVNPLELLILSGSVRLIQDYPMPLTLGNECSGVVKAVGEAVTGFRAGDKVYTRLPLSRIGAFAEYVAVEQAALSPMPAGYDFSDAAAIPLTGLTAWQGLTEELEVQRGKTLLIPGGSGSFGQMAVPLAKALGLHVIVTGNARARASIMAAGADRYLDYRKENYWEVLSGVDYVMDTLGAGEFSRELSVLKPGGRLLSLRTGPNKAFAERHHLGPAKRLLFTAAGAGYDRAARKQGKEYRFLFVRADGAQLREVTRIVEQNHILPRTDPRTFTLETAREALELVKNGPTDGKVLLRL
ncbi:NADP-dependent oxidoreductase [uncultured Gemmiger sp.]|uniref:NADP-dependent oxidoreductase n=1 Tax=uncultured Gemmiger sp. TaxID=1623490 RepID=UPI0025E14F7D|nr:NADP-dependent oxidoreductase [uncultured Gemmiger sp.]